MYLRIILENETCQEYKSVTRTGEETSETCLLVSVYHTRPGTETLVSRTQWRMSHRRSHNPQLKTSTLTCLITSRIIAFLFKSFK